MRKKLLIFGILFTMLISQAVGCGKKDEKKDNTGSAEYSSKLFDQSYVHVVNIVISEADWADLKTNPLNKTKYHVDIEIDGETVKDVSFATKGNTSLTSIASDSNSDRYSFKVNFGKYVDDQTYYGLDKLNLNNIYADATYMKDYVSYEIFRAVGVDAPLTSYVDLRINGESFGLYLAIEEVGDSYLDRTDNEDSQLYKPETEMLGNIGNAGADKNPGENAESNGGDGTMTPPDGTTFPGFGNNGDGTGTTTPPDGTNFPGFGNNGDGTGTMTPPDGTTFPGFGDNGDGTGTMTPPDGTTFPGMGENGEITMPGGIFDFAGGSNGASLAYTDDKMESYSDIFDNAVTKATDEDKQKVIAALKKLSEGSTSEAIDTTEVIKYFVAHNFVMNYDSYTGTMLHNYYLMETEGKLSILPWDYNLGFGAFGGGDATACINCGIDSPLSGNNESQRPLWNCIVSDEKLLAQYHEEYAKLIEYINSGKLETELNRVYNMIHSYVEKDSSAFYTVSEFETAFTNLSNFCKLRAESIEKQLSGQLATVTSNQNAADKVDASNVNISAMGTQGGGNNEMPGNFGGDINGQQNPWQNGQQNPWQNGQQNPWQNGQMNPGQNGSQWPDQNGSQNPDTGTN